MISGSSARSIKSLTLARTNRETRSKMLIDLLLRDGVASMNERPRVSPRSAARMLTRRFPKDFNIVRVDRCAGSHDRFGPPVDDDCLTIRIERGCIDTERDRPLRGGARGACQFGLAGGGPL